MSAARHFFLDDQINAQQCPSEWHAEMNIRKKDLCFFLVMLTFTKTRRLDKHLEESYHSIYLEFSFSSVYLVVLDAFIYFS
jgi:hypothetical protein